MKTYKNETTEIYACDSYDRVGLGIHTLRVPDARASYALDLIKVMTGPLMFDGHAGARRMTPAEIANTACDVASEAFKAFSDRGWLIDVPSMDELKDEARENRGRN